MFRLAPEIEYRWIQYGAKLRRLTIVFGVEEILGSSLPRQAAGMEKLFQVVLNHRDHLPVARYAHRQRQCIEQIVEIDRVERFERRARDERTCVREVIQPDVLFSCCLLYTSRCV